MRKTMGALAVVVMMGMGGRAARAQDATAMAMQASQQAQMNMQMAMNAANDANYYLPPPRPALPMTPRPVMTPSGGRFKGSVQVAIADADPRAIVFYTTDGTAPTLRSQRYAGPIAVSAKEKVRALAFDLNEMPSGVVSKMFRMKS